MRNLIAKLGVVLVLSIGFGSVGCGGGGGGGTGEELGAGEAVVPSNPIRPGGGSANSLSLTGRLVLLYDSSASRSAYNSQIDVKSTVRSRYVYANVPDLKIDLFIESWSRKFVSGDYNSIRLYSYTTGNKLYLVFRYEDIDNPKPGIFTTMIGNTIQEYRYDSLRMEWLATGASVQFEDAFQPPAGYGGADNWAIIGNRVVYVEVDGKESYTQTLTGWHRVVTANGFRFVYKEFGSQTVTRSALQRYYPGKLLGVGQSLVQYVHEPAENKGFYLGESVSSFYPPADKTADGLPMPADEKSVFAGDDAIYWADFNKGQTNSLITVHRLGTDGVRKSRTIQFADGGVLIKSASLDQEGGKVLVSIVDGAGYVSRVYQLGPTQVNGDSSYLRLSSLGFAAFPVGDSDNLQGQFMIMP